MKGVAQIPTIQVIYDETTECWMLLCSSYGETMPAGPRLFRRAPTPNIEFRHATKEQADDAAQKLREYIAWAWTGKEPTMNEVVDPVWEV